MSAVEDVLAWCEHWNGFTEGPRNANPFSAMTGLVANDAWCAEFVCAAMLAAGAPIPPGGLSAYTPTQLAAYQRAGLMLPAGADPAPGDIGWVYYLSLRSVGHVFVVRDVQPRSDSVTTWEGNTNQAASASGGQVASLRRDYRSRSGGAYVFGFARPRYDGRRLPMLPNLPVRAERTGAMVIPAVMKTPPAAAELVVDGDWGPATTRALQRALGVSADGALGPQTLTALQRLLNRYGARLALTGRRDSATIRALQGYLGCVRDGVIDAARSACVMALQRRLNAGTFTRTTTA